MTDATAPSGSPPEESPFREVLPVEAVRGTVRVPGSKSAAHRLLAIAALADGSSTVSGLNAGSDVVVTREGLAALGIDVQASDDGTSARVKGCAARPPGGDADIWLADSGTSARLLTALACLGRGRRELDGIPRLRKRPLAPLVAALRTLGAGVDGDALPLEIQARGLRGGTVELDGSTSGQFASALLLAGPAMDAPMEAVVRDAVSRPYVEMTARLLEQAGANVTVERRGNDLHLRTEPGAPTARDVRVEGDASAAAVLLCAVACAGGELRVEGVGADTEQADRLVLDALRDAGCETAADEDAWTIRAGARPTGFEADLSDAPDLAVPLAAVACAADGPCRLEGIGRLRHKETDRLEGIAEVCRSAGHDVRLTEDALEFRPGRDTQVVAVTVDPVRNGASDHRLAMLGALLSLRVFGVRILRPGCVDKSWPGFFEDLEEVCVR